MRNLIEWKDDFQVPADRVVQEIFGSAPWRDIPYNIVSQVIEQCPQLQGYYEGLTNPNIVFILTKEELNRFKFMFIENIEGMTFTGEYFELLTQKQMWELYNDSFTVEELITMFTDLIDDSHNAALHELWDLWNQNSVRPYVDLQMLEADIIDMIGGELV